MFFLTTKTECRYLHGTPDGAYSVGPVWAGEKRKVADSLAEWKRWKFLEGEAAAGRIQGLRMQPRFVLHGPNGAKLATYTADFFYIKVGRRIVEDVKSPMTIRLAMYRLKKGWMLDEYGISIVEIV